MDGPNSFDDRTAANIYANDIINNLQPSETNVLVNR